MSKPSLRRAFRVALLMLLAGALAGLAAPFINASHWSRSIKNTLESWLGRRVDFGAVHFTLFSGPGFSLEDVTIHEDPRYGLEPFAHATALDARLRIDKLLRGQIRFSSLRLIEPSLNVVKRSDGTWNVLELVQRLAAPRRAPLNLFSTFEISKGRVNFKMDTRKTTFYIADSDLSVYPERSGKLYLQFSGSPARTDRAGAGFGHLRGAVNWYLAPVSSDANQLEADVTVDPSNLSELTTLIEGYDIGVHGMMSSHMQIEGPVSALRIKGELRLVDVHRWDLLPASGEEGRVGYRGDIDLRAQTLRLETAPARESETAPTALEVRVNDFLSHPQWAVLARLNDAPARDLAPLARRMGLPIPEQFAVQGAMYGVVSYSSRSGLEGGVSIKDVAVTAPGTPALRATEATAQLSPNHIRLEPAVVETPAGGTLQLAGDYSLSTQRLVASVTADELVVRNSLPRGGLFGVPEAFGIFGSGTVTGRLTCAYEPKLQPVWSGQLQFTNATLKLPALSEPLQAAEGRVTFDDTRLSLERFSALLNGQAVHATYQYDAASRRPERLRVEMASVDLNNLEAALDPILRGQSLLARLRISVRSIPAWLQQRNLDGEVSIANLSVQGNDIGRVGTRFTWEGTGLRVSSLDVNLPVGIIHAKGRLDLKSYSPQYRLTGTLSGFSWAGGLLNADGELKTSGTGSESLRNLQVSGTFSGRDIRLSSDDEFRTISGDYDVSFADGWPNLHLSGIQASDGEDEWIGQGATQNDGKLIVDLEHDGQVRHLVSSLTTETSPRGGSTLTSSTLAR
jgi:uncharacterized protein involved in outer membrane biogenesis